LDQEDDGTVVPNDKNPYIGILDRASSVALGNPKASKTQRVSEQPTPRGSTLVAAKEAFKG